MLIKFHVSGKPTPQGSHTVFNRGGRPIISHTNTSALNKWRGQVREEALKEAEACGWPLNYNEPVIVVLEFRIKPPKKPKFKFPAVKPDLDKLIRSTIDALASSSTELGLFSNDSRVVCITAVKVYAEEEGVAVIVEDFSEDS